MPSTGIQHELHLDHGEYLPKLFDTRVATGRYKNVGRVRVGALFQAGCFQLILKKQDTFPCKQQPMTVVRNTFRNICNVEPARM
jgi:hypothetical protein